MALSLFGGRRNNVFDPFSLDIWEPFVGFGALANLPSSAPQTTAIVNTRIDWKETPEAHIFKADLQGIKLKSFEITPSKNPTLIQHLMALSLYGGRRNNGFDPFSLDIWDPFEGFGALANIPSSARETTAIANIPSSARETTAFANIPSSARETTVANTRFDWMETQEAHIFKANLPGIKKEEVRLEVVAGTVLQICERSREQEENDTWNKVERSGGKFMRRVRLPENAKLDLVQAAMENGVLTVTLPKEVKTPDVRIINISG